MSIFEFDREEYERQVRAEEREEVSAKCIAKGREEGAYDKAVSTARNLLSMKILSVQQIAQATSLSVEEVAAL